jgi:hypothetical protein
MACCRQLAVVLTYDDALSSHLDIAIPALDATGLKGTFFLIAGASSPAPRRKRVAGSGGSVEINRHALRQLGQASGDDGMGMIQLPIHVQGAPPTPALTKTRPSASPSFGLRPHVRDRAANARGFPRGCPQSYGFSDFPGHRT